MQATHAFLRMLPFWFIIQVVEGDDILGAYAMGNVDSRDPSGAESSSFPIVNEYADTLQANAMERANLLRSDSHETNPMIGMSYVKFVY